jgi:uncharacterized cupin superfamily protein
MHSKLEELPVAMDAAGARTHLQQGLGGMTVAFWKMSRVDSRPMLKGLEHDCCPCPHWGYMIKGKMRVIYQDGNEETVSAGDIFYFPAGHNGIADEEVEWLEFSPEKELSQVMEHIAKQQQQQIPAFSYF